MVLQQGRYPFMPCQATLQRLHVETCACCTEAHVCISCRSAPQDLATSGNLTTGILPLRLPPHQGKLPWERRACCFPLLLCPQHNCHAQGLAPAEQTKEAA